MRSGKISRRNCFQYLFILSVLVPLNRTCLSWAANTLFLPSIKVVFANKNTLFFFKQKYSISNKNTLFFFKNTLFFFQAS